MTLPRDIQFQEDARLFVWRPRGVLDDAALKNVLGYLEDLDAKLQDFKASRRLIPLSNDTAVQKNPDGSTDIYFGPAAPAGKESNWVPTDPKRQSELLFRLYGPKKELFEKTWKLPDVEEVK